MTAPQLSTEWHQARKNRVTGSMVGAILGLSPFMSRDVAMRSMVRAAHDAPAEFTGNPATAWGNANEASAVLDYEMDACQDTQECGFFPHEDWLGASPDRLVGGKGLLEIKCPYGMRQTPPPVPFKPLAEQPHYGAQVQIEMLCAGRQFAHFYQWAPAGQKLETVFPDNDWLATNLPILRAFYDEFLHERDHNAAVHLEPLRAVIDTPAAMKMVAEYDDLTEAISRAEERRKDLLAEIATACGGKDTLFAGRKLTLVEKAGSVSYAAVVKKLLPDTDLEPWRAAGSSYWRLTNNYSKDQTI